MKFWEDILLELEKNLSDQVVDTWFRPLRYVAFENKSLLMEAPHRFFREWIEENYLEQFLATASRVAGSEISVRFIANDWEENGNAIFDGRPLTPHPPEPARDRVSTILNPQYTFENFVVGHSNQFANAACLAVATNPARHYNPLFIYGGVGLGKTHLLNAIGNHALNNNPTGKVCFMSSEKFTNELITSIRFQKIDLFREKFRSVDILLIDDVQFIAGKERTQEEFFHTFNDLYNSNKQIVVTSDNLPKDIQDLEERLRSRFEWGLIADIQLPDVETKVAILKKKAEMLRIALPDDVAFFLASSVKSNIRELEGSLKRLHAYSSLANRDITLNLSKEVLSSMLPEGDRNISPDLIMKVVASFFQTKMSDLKSSRKHKVITHPRQIGMYLMRQFTNLSLPEIGQKFGGRDHSTVIHAVKKIESRIAEDPQTQQIVDNLINLLKSS
ncbi:MAG: chromosomal replication initiator protein DnaA [Deltaproteobacteria bacterium]|nr:chromosomal replication initiator protein DnaA [Deltaproteobacteria bacterium]NIS76090.1 chromosomal replication initiator protein DnaA [Deltaproteobacteria bacterium]